MELSDDLMMVVSLYATPLVTEVLTTFTPELVRDAAWTPSFWRLKATKEANGLVLNDDIVVDKSPLDWYSYYLVRNRTWYGVVSIVSDTSTTRIARPCLAAYSFERYGDIHTLIQWGNYNVSVRTATTVEVHDTFPRARLVGFASYKSIFDDPIIVVVLLLFDTGVLYDYTESGLREVARDVVAVHRAYPGAALVLFRTGVGAAYYNSRLNPLPGEYVNVSAYGFIASDGLLASTTMNKTIMPGGSSQYTLTRTTKRLMDKHFVGPSIVKGYRPLDPYSRHLTHTTVNDAVVDFIKDLGNRKGYFLTNLRTLYVVTFRDDESVTKAYVTDSYEGVQHVELLWHSTGTVALILSDIQ